MTLHKSRLMIAMGTLFVVASIIALSAQESSAPTKLKVGDLKVRTWKKPSQLSPQQIQTMTQNQPSLPLWSFGLTSSRDGNQYTGVVVGKDPTKPNSGETDVPTQLVPFIFVTNLVVTSINPDGSFNTTPGQTVFDPTAIDPNCLTAPNNVPLTLVQQSPIIQHASFTFGGTFVGNTQYVDASQRANFWNVIKQNKYHVLLKPVTTLTPIIINVPAASGVALPPSLFQNPPCGPEGEIDINFLDPLIAQVILPALFSQGVNSATFPIFPMYNTVLSEGTPAFNNCCILGYHGFNNIQTYSPVDFQTAQIFPPSIADTSIMAHEVGEWMNDPLVFDFTPAWGHIGQVGGCQNNYEVGDPLTGTNVATVTMSNGFTYHLQELAFFNWFYGAPSIGVNGWFSDNGTFTSDAGPVCQ